MSDVANMPQESPAPVPRRRPAVRITLDRRLGPRGCHRGHVPGDSWDFDTQRGELCPMAMHVAFLYADILRYGGSIPGQPAGHAEFCCPDADTINVFTIDVVDPSSTTSEKD